MNHKKKPIYPDTDTFLHSLVNLGLSLDAAKCYQALVKSGSLTSEELARQIGVLPNAVYRLTKKLSEKGLVILLDTYPIKYQPLSAEIALDSLAQERLKEIERAKTMALHSLKTNSDAISSTKIEILTGWQSMMRTYVSLAKTAREEILIVSIGESVPDEVKLANRDALERNVNIKFIIQKYAPDNKELIRSWIKMGMEVHLYPEPGYHLVVADGKKCILSSSNPENPQERNSVVIHGQGISKAMKHYFDSIWKESAVIRD